jgi:hypothetical protein
MMFPQAVALCLIPSLKFANGFQGSGFPFPLSLKPKLFQ